MEKNLTAYLSNIRNVLTRGKWHYSPEQAAKIVLAHLEYLQEKFNNSVPSWEAAMEIGFNGEVSAA